MKRVLFLKCYSERTDDVCHPQDRIEKRKIIEQIREMAASERKGALSCLISQNIRSHKQIQVFQMRKPV